MVEHALMWMQLDCGYVNCSMSSEEIIFKDAISIKSHVSKKSYPVLHVQMTSHQWMTTKMKYKGRLIIQAMKMRKIHYRYIT